MAECLAKRLVTLSEPGALVALQIQEHLVSTSEGLDLMPAISRILTETSLTANTVVHARALVWAANLIERDTSGELISASRTLTQKCLGDDTAGNRLQAIRLALRPEIDLLEALVPLLSDPVAEVRRAAILALGPVPGVLNTDDLLRWLHDPDAGVRALCADALRSRGLKAEHIQLGRLMTDDRPEVRLQVVERLRTANDLDPGIWLRQLSHDSAPAVRAAAIRAATEQAVGSLRDRLEQMTQNDPCPSIRQLAQYYLTAHQSGANNLAEP
jgi:HEAT repeat protein